MRALFGLGAGERGGAERALLALVRHLPDHGVDPVVAAMAKGPFVDELVESGVEVIHLPEVPRLRAGWALPAAIWRLADAARSTRADVIVGSGEKMALLAVPAARRAGSRSAAWLHDAPGHTASGRWIQHLLGRVAPDVAIASSRWMSQAFAARLGRPVECVPYGLELAELTDVPAAPDVCAGWEGRTVFCFVGRLQHWKGVDVYLRAAADLHRRHGGDVGFLVLGGSLFGREEGYAATLRTLAADLGLGDAVRFLGHRDDAREVMAAADVVVHASRLPEPLGIVVLEAMALAKPVIASRTRGPEELIDDGRTGLLTPPDDPRALARAMDQLATAGRAARAEMGEAARAAFDVEWSAPAMASRFSVALRRGGDALDVALVAQNVVRGDGQGRFALELGRELALRGHRLTVYSHTCDPDLQPLARLRRVPRPPGPQILDDLLFLARTTPELRLANHDAVCVLGPTGLPHGSFALAAQYSHAGWRATWAGSGQPELRLRASAAVSERLERFVATRATKIITLSPQISDDLAPGHSAETVVITNGVDLDEFTVASSEAKREARQALGIESDSLVAGFVGEHITSRKGLGPLLEALAKGPGREHLVIAGRGPDLREQLDSLGIRHRVTALGFVDPRVLYAACDAVVVPSWYEPFSIVAAEAAASGLPVILTRAVGAAPLLKDAAIVIDEPRPEQIRSALDLLWADEARRLALGAAGRTAAEGLRWELARKTSADAVESLGRSNRAGGST